MADWLLLAIGFAAGAFASIRSLPIAAIGLGTALLLAGDRLGVFTH